MPIVAGAIYAWIAVNFARDVRKILRDRVRRANSWETIDPDGMRR